MKEDKPFPAMNYKRPEKNSREMNPEALTTSIINKCHGRVLTDASTREALEKALKKYGEYRYKEGLLMYVKIRNANNQVEANKIINNIVEMI